MLTKIQNISSLKYIWLFIALYLLNCSVDSSDISNNTLASNHQESIIEVFVEQILGFKDAIAEVEDSDAETDATLKKVNAVDTFIIPNFLQFQNAFNLIKNPTFNLDPHLDIEIPYFKIPSPPPEA